MRRTILCGIGAAAMALTLAVPAYAETSGGNGGLGNGMGTHTHGMQNGFSANQAGGNRMYVQSIDGTERAQSLTNHEVSVYGTGTGSQFLNGNSYGTTDRNRGYRAQSNVTDRNMTDRNTGYRTQSYANDGYRAMATTTSRHTDWGWLGLLGLLGLFGMRSRNPQRDR